MTTDDPIISFISFFACYFTDMSVASDAVHYDALLCSTIYTCNHDPPWNVVVTDKELKKWSE